MKKLRKTLSILERNNTRKMCKLNYQVSAWFKYIRKNLVQFFERKRTKVKTWRVKTSAQKMHKLKLPSSHLIQKNLKKLRRKLSAHNT